MAHDITTVYERDDWMAEATINRRIVNTQVIRLLDGVPVHVCATDERLGVAGARDEATTRADAELAVRLAQEDVARFEQEGE